MMGILWIFFKTSKPMVKKKFSTKRYSLNKSQHATSIYDQITMTPEAQILH